MSSMQIGIVCVLLIFAYWTYVGILNLKRKERRLWNKGKCRCGAKWKLFTLPKDQGRGYCCEQCQKFIWITFRGIDE